MPPLGAVGISRLQAGEDVNVCLEARSINHALDAAQGRCHAVRDRAHDLHSHHTIRADQQRFAADPANCPEVTNRGAGGNMHSVAVVYVFALK